MGARELSQVWCGLEPPICNEVARPKSFPACGARYISKCKDMSANAKVASDIIILQIGAQTPPTPLPLVLTLEFAECDITFCMKIVCFEY